MEYIGVLNRIQSKIKMKTLAIQIVNWFIRP
jgi:hypothetical protein